MSWGGTGTFKIFLDNFADESDVAASIDASSTKGELSLYSNNNKTVTIDGDGNSYINSGNVGIGITSPSAKLDVDGEIKSTSATISGTVAFDSLKDSGEDITITKLVDEADTIASNNNDTTIPTSAAVDAHIKSKSSTDRSNNYKIMGLAMDYLSRVNDDGGVVEGME